MYAWAKQPAYHQYKVWEHMDWLMWSASSTTARAEQYYKDCECCRSKPVAIELLMVLLLFVLVAVDVDVHTATLQACMTSSKLKHTMKFKRFLRHLFSAQSMFGAVELVTRNELP